MPPWVVAWVRSLGTFRNKSSDESCAAIAAQWKTDFCSDLTKSRDTDRLGAPRNFASAINVVLRARFQNQDSRQWKIMAYPLSSLKSDRLITSALPEFRKNYEVTFKRMEWWVIRSEIEASSMAKVKSREQTKCWHWSKFEMTASLQKLAANSEFN